MRILWFNHRDIRHPLAGGAERTIYEVGRRLVEEGHEVHVVSVNPGCLLKREVIEGIIIHRIMGNINTHLFDPMLIRKLKPDAIVDDLAHAIPWCSNLFTPKKVIVFFHHLHARTLPGQVNFILSRMIRQMERKYASVYSDNMFVTETSFNANDLLALGIRKEHIVQIPPGVDSSLFVPSAKSEEPSFVYFGGMRNYKRPWLAVEAIRVLSEAKGYKLTVIGDGKNVEKMKRLANINNLENRIAFVGRVSINQLVEQISSAWFNLHFATAEGFGFSILEAAACGTPTIAIDAPGVSEVVSAFGLGKIVEKVNDIPSASNEMLGDFEDWSRRVRRSAKLFSWDKCAEAWEELISKT